MDHNNPVTPKDPGGEPDLIADLENCESFHLEKEQRKSSCMVTDDLSTNGNWSQRSISRSLLRAESLFRSTFNPSLKWLFHDHSQDEEENNFVVAHNLVSRSSARLQRLQQSLLDVACQWQLVGGAQMGSPQVCVKGLPVEGGVVLHSSSIQGEYRVLRRLLEQRSLLLFLHEYTRRVRLTAAHTSRVNNLLEQQLNRSASKENETPSSWSSFRVGLGSLSQELRVHLSHWCCLFSKVHSDHYLRQALAHQSRLLEKMKRILDLLGLQLLVLMEQYVFAILSAVGKTQSDSVPRDVLEDILEGTDLYNQAVEEHRGQHSASQLRIAVLQQAHYSPFFTRPPKIIRYYPSVFSVSELMTILAMRHAEKAARQLHHWTCEQSCKPCCWISTLRSECTWEQLQRTYLISPPHLFNNQATQQLSSLHTPPPVYISDHHSDSISLENHQPVLAVPTFVQQREETSKNDQISQCQTRISQSHLSQINVETSDLIQPNVERKISFENNELLQSISPPSATSQHLSALPLSQVCQLNHSSVELLFQVLVSSNELLTPLISHGFTTGEPTEKLLLTTIPDMFDLKADSASLCASGINTAHPAVLNKGSTKLSKCQNVERTLQDWAELDSKTRSDIPNSTGFQRDGDSEKEDQVGTRATMVEPDDVYWPHSVQWFDLGRSLLLSDLLGQYRNLLWIHCNKAFWLKLHVSQAGNTINLQNNHGVFKILHRISQAFETGQFPKECKTMLENFSLYLFVLSAHAHWDYVACRSLGSALRDKCLRNEGNYFAKPSSKQERSVIMSHTMENFLLLSPPLLSSLCCHHSNCQASGSFSFLPSRSALQRQTIMLVLAAVQLSSLWVMTKAYQFLSSWSLNKFLLITQGDLEMLMESLDTMMQQTKSVMMHVDADHHSTLHSHNQQLLRQQLEALGCAVSKLQTFSSLVLTTFSTDCKRMSGEIFERTMPSAVHWRPSNRTGFSNCPSIYASQAAQTVIGQVLDGVAPLSDDARVQALSITMTAFMEAWMEHILKQKIKFSVQGALQLKQDFDSIREMIQSDKYGLSAELHQRLLSLGVFQQVDSAVMCLLQQPQAKPYLQCTAWEPFTRCCPANRSRDSIDTPVASNITNLGCMEGKELTQSDPSVVTSDLHLVDPSTSAEPYLVPSLALGPVQQEWLDLRIQSGTRRWRLPSLQCLSKAEP
ncbi:uncharacterized protein ccdc142 [Leuresthes tenuis]|uniref:uncharacterized protein ccdc142 n=1 Tax=Leuresthes tenuis TaxID=355514 RepID=UPI003B50C0F9